MNTSTVWNADPALDLGMLCITSRGLIENGDYRKCFDLICQAMALFPDAPEPHNLLGILLEKEGNHCSAMKHFRAAVALDPGYRPVQENLGTYGTFFSTGKSNYGDQAYQNQPEVVIPDRCHIVSFIRRDQK